MHAAISDFYTYMYHNTLITNYSTIKAIVIYIYKHTTYACKIIRVISLHG